MKKFIITMIFSTLLVGCSNYSDSTNNSSSYDDNSSETTVEESTVEETGEETVETIIEDNRADRMTTQEYRETYLSEVDNEHMENKDGYVYVYFDSILGKSEQSVIDGFCVSDGKHDDGKISSIELAAGTEEYFSIQEYYLDGMIQYINSLMNDGQDYSYLKDQIKEHIDAAYEYRQDMLFDFSTDFTEDEVVLMENDEFKLTQLVSLTRYNSSNIATAQIHIGNRITLEHK